MPIQNNPEYILLPKNSLKAANNIERSVLTSLPMAKSTGPTIKANLGGGIDQQIEIIDTTSEDGPKLIKTSEEIVGQINSSRSPLRAIPVVNYSHPRLNFGQNKISNTTGAANTTLVTVTIKDAITQQGVANMNVYAYTDFSNNIVAQGLTDNTGQVQLNLSGAQIEKLFVYPSPGYWGVYRSNLNIQSNMNFDSTPVSFGYNDCIRSMYSNSNFNANTGVRVAVLDTGVGPHNHINLIHGQNTVTGENRSDFDDWDGHGTHVSGLIGANSGPPNGFRGLAPNVEIVGLRVFGNNNGYASNYAIIKAMIIAQDLQSDIINLSLGGGPSNDIVEEAIIDAKNQGIMVVVAAGNDSRKAVNYPAAYPGAIGVSAMGIQNTFPVGSLDEANIFYPPTGSLNNDFIASFSNIGREIDIVGLGVATISTLPNQQYGPMSGTSMAAPMVCGAAACLLSRDLNTHGSVRDIQRSDDIEQLLLTNCTSRGFGRNFEGFGLPDPQLI